MANQVTQVSRVIQELAAKWEPQGIRVSKVLRDTLDSMVFQVSQDTKDYLVSVDFRAIPAKLELAVSLVTLDCPDSVALSVFRDIPVSRVTPEAREQAVTQALKVLVDTVVSKALVDIVDTVAPLVIQE